MKITVSGDPVFLMPLSLRQVQLISSLSAAHYDGVCRSASQVGGFIYGWTNRLTFANDAALEAIARGEQPEEAPQVGGTWRQLDTVLKICEMCGHLNEADRKEVYALSRAILKAMAITNDLVPSWKEEIDTDCC